jgi:hypothetical protein
MDALKKVPRMVNINGKITVISVMNLEGAL